MGFGDMFALLLPVVMFGFAAAFAVASRWNPKAARLWAAGYALAGGAYVVPLAPDGAPLVLQALVADGGFLVAFRCFGAALAAHFGAPRRARLDALVVGLGFAGAVYAVAGIGDLRAELLVNDVACSALLLIPLASVWRRARGGLDRALVGVNLLVVLDNLTRTIVFNLLLPATADLETYFTSPYAVAMQFSGAALGLVGGLVTLGALAMRAVDGYRQEAERDPLTGLHNRRGFERAAAANRPASVILCDIDHFKAVNDAFGHPAGDRVLAAFAAIVRIVLPPGGAAARFGGEEFVLLVPGPPAVAATIAEALRLAFAERDWGAEGVDRPLTASFGTAEADPADRSLAGAIAQADRNLYAAKAAGRNRVVGTAARPPAAESDAAARFAA